MTSLKSSESDSIISVEYDDFTNTVEIHIGNETGFRFVHLAYEQCETIKELLDDAKNQIV